MTLTTKVAFPNYSGLRCLMMPYIQGDPDSVPTKFSAYYQIIEDVHLAAGEVGFLTVDESPVNAGQPHRGERARYGRALHTEAGIIPGDAMYGWGTPLPPAWGGSLRVTLEPDVEILLANNLDGSCAVWDAVHHDTSVDGDIGDQAHMYPYQDATFLGAGEVHRIGILTPHESLPIDADVNRQFLRIVGSGVHGREPYFTENPLLCMN